MATRRGAQRPTARRNRGDEVLEAAIDVFWKKGYAAASIQDVADRVGVLKGSLYHYIDSKEELLFQIFDEAHREARAIMDEAAELDAPAIERLTIYFERYLVWYLKNLERGSLYMSEWRYLTGARRTTVLQQRREYEKFVRDLVEEAQEEGDVPRDLEPKYASFFILGAVNAASTWYRRTGPDKPERIAATYARMVAGALSAAPG